MKFIKTGRRNFVYRGAGPNVTSLIYFPAGFYTYSTLFSAIWRINRQTKFGGRNIMAVPLDAIRAFHNAFRKDLAAIDAVANNAARGKGNLDLLVKRYNFFNEVLVWHAKGEEEYVFPALEKVAPLMAEAYERDHRGLDSLYEKLQKAVNASDTLSVARATASFDFFLAFHLNKEEAHLYRIYNDKVSIEDQWVIGGKMFQEVPRERFPEVVAWLYPLLGLDDRENVTRIMQKNMPEPAFAGATKLIQAAVGNGWAELDQRLRGKK
jgi:hemerythrin-like domain-containing protein